MAGFEFFDRDLRLATAGLEPAAVNAALAKFARAELAKAISAGASPQYDKFVNGREGASEETVRAPGPVLYVFSNWTLIINAALAELKRRSPRRSGRYAESFVVVVGGRVAVTDFSRIRADGEIIIFNDSPQTRKVEVGANRTGRRHFDASRASLSARFRGAFKFETKFVNVPSRISPRAPYIIKRGKQAGKQLTYPALVINVVS